MHNKFVIFISGNNKIHNFYFRSEATGFALVFSSYSKSRATEYGIAFVLFSSRRGNSKFAAILNHSIVIVSFNIINNSQHFRCLAVRVLVWSRCKYVLFRIASTQRKQSFLLSFVQVPICYANGEPVLPHESSISIICGKVHITESYTFIINSFVSRQSI